MLLGVSLAFVLLIYQFQAIHRWEFFVLSLLIFVFLILRRSRKRSAGAQEDDFLEEVKSYPWKSTTYLVLGGLALYYGADFLINGTIAIAREWGVTERVISISLVAIGTSVLSWLHR